MKPFALCSTFLAFVVFSVAFSDAQQQSSLPPVVEYGTLASHQSTDNKQHVVAQPAPSSGCQGQAQPSNGQTIRIRTPAGYEIEAPAGTPVYFRRRPLLGPQIRVGNPEQTRGAFSWLFGR